MGTRTVDYEFGSGSYAVQVLGAPGRFPVVRVHTPLRRERTPRGIGPGSLERKLLRAYPATRCERLATLVASGTTWVTVDERTCTLFAPSGRRTTFVTGVPRNVTFVALRDWSSRARVLEIGISERR